MGITIVYIEEVVGEYIECDCGYTENKDSSRYNDTGYDQLDEFTCPDCGETHQLEPDWRTD